MMTDVNLSLYFKKKAQISEVAVFGFKQWFSNCGSVLLVVHGQFKFNPKFCIWATHLLLTKLNCRKFDLLVLC